MLSVLLWTPLITGVLILLLPRNAARWLAVVGSLVVLGLAIGLVADFDPDAAGLQHVIDDSWIPDLKMTVDFVRFLRPELPDYADPLNTASVPDDVLIKVVTPSGA